MEIRRGNIADDGEDKDYRRFEDRPISERRFLGDGKMWYTGSEHDEYGNVSEDPENRMKMQEKRMKKLEAARGEMPVDKMVRYYGPEEAEFLLIGWGSVKGVALDVLDDIGSGAYLHLKTFSPSPKEKFDRYLTGST